jgi:hypothetical protein
MITVAVQIGNSDDKLSQFHWAAFIDRTQKTIERRAKQIHFHGHSMPTAPWQNAGWVFEVEEKQAAELQFELSDLAKDFKQDAIAYTFGRTIMINPARL